MPVEGISYVRFKDIGIAPSRYRKKFSEIESLVASIRKYGLVSSLVVALPNAAHGETGCTLVAGERRLRAIGEIRDEDYEEYKSLFPEGIPVRFANDLTPEELKAIELEENIKREDLHWKERCLAYLEYHQNYIKMDPERTIYDTADALVISGRAAQEYVGVGRALAEEDEQVETCGEYVTARNLLRRRRERAVDHDIDFMDETITEVLADDYDETDAGGPGISPDAPTLPREDRRTRPATKDILETNFFEQVQSYTGPKFNFIHCDFPYGIEYHKSSQGGSKHKDSYDDAPELYWKFVNDFIAARDRLMAKSAHIMFWFSMKYYQETVDAFNSNGFTVLRWPLVWHKSDNKGILPDPERGPRNTYETALFITRGDRKVVRATASSYAAPTQRGDSVHLSQKPIPVLRHFFRMLVDDTTSMLDPTCGSGTALCAAELTNAKTVQGWEIKPEFVESARSELNKTRQLFMANREMADENP